MAKKALSPRYCGLFSFYVWHELAKESNAKHRDAALERITDTTGCG